MRPAASGALVAVKRTAVKAVNKVKILPVYASVEKEHTSVHWIQLAQCKLQWLVNI
jgi:hypothetical protein